MSSLTSTGSFQTQSLSLSSTTGTTSSTSASAPFPLLKLSDDQLHTIFCELLTPIEQLGSLRASKKIRAVILGDGQELVGSSKLREFRASRLSHLFSGQSKTTSITSKARFYSFQYLPEQSLLVTGGLKGHRSVACLMTWNASTGEQLGTFESFDSVQILDRVQFDPQHNLAFATTMGADRNLCTWNTNTRTLLRVIQTEDMLPFAQADAANQTWTYSTVRDYLNFRDRFDDGRLQIRNYETGQRISFGGNDQACNWCHDDASRNRLLSCNRRRVLTIWDRETQQPLFTQAKVADGNEKIAYDAASGELLFCVDNELRLLNVDAPTKQRTFSQSDESAAVATVHRTAAQVFAGFAYREKGLERTKVVMWDVYTGKITHSFVARNERNLCYLLKQIDYDPSNQIVFTSGYGAQLWTLQGKLLWHTHTETVNTTVWDKTGNKIVVFNNFYHTQQKTDGTVTIYDYATAKDPKPESKETPETKSTETKSQWPTTPFVMPEES